MMMKLSSLLLFFCCCLLASLEVKSQTIVGMGTDNPNTNAVLELVSEHQDQGFLVPRLSTEQRNAAGFTSRLSSQDNGLLVFDTDIGAFYHWYEGAWRPGSGAGDLQKQPLDENKMLVGNAWGEAAPVSISGDISLNSDGTMTITLDAVTTAKILNQAVTTAKIADKAVTKDKIADQAVTREKIHTDVAGNGLIQSAEGSLEINISGGGLQLKQDQLQLVNTGDAELLIGDGTQINSRVISGDINLSNNGVATIAGLQGKPLEASNPADGDILAWNGSSWIPASVSSSLISSDSNRSAWYAGNSEPDAAGLLEAVGGDYYYHTGTQIVYRKESDIWNELGKWMKPSSGTVEGATISETTPTLYIGEGDPRGKTENAQPGDLYFDTSDGAYGRLWIKMNSIDWKNF